MQTHFSIAAILSSVSIQVFAFTPPCQRSPGVVSYLEKVTKLPCELINVEHIRGRDDAVIESEEFQPGDLDGFSQLYYLELKGDVRRLDLGISLDHLRQLRSLSITTGTFDFQHSLFPNFRILASSAFVPIRFTS